MSLNPEFKAKWVAALRSGDYQQTVGQLRADTAGWSAFCCLGVACDISGAGEWAVSKLNGLPAYRYGDEIEQSGVMPFSLAEGLGLEVDSQTVLAKKNDDGYSFSGIADYIEANL